LTPDCLKISIGNWRLHGLIYETYKTMPTFGSITRLHKPVNLLPMISQRTLHSKDAPVHHQVSRRRIDQRLSQAPPHEYRTDHSAHPWKT
jgi:hypothetical protein